MTRLNSNTAIAGGTSIGVMSGSHTGPTIDCQFFKSLFWVGALHRLVGAATLLAQHSDDGTNWTNVPAADLHGVDPSFSGDGVLIVNTGSPPNTSIRLGLTSKKQYQRAVLQDDGSWTGFVGVILVRSKHSHAMADDQFIG